jgi:NTE family protein
MRAMHTRRRLHGSTCGVIVRRGAIAQRECRPLAQHPVVITPAQHRRAALEDPQALIRVRDGAPKRVAQGRRTVWFGSFAALAVLIAPAVFAQEGMASQAAPPTSAVERPHVGLVLAGGGAKGGAHVGVLKVLEEMHVPIDCIAGTSMGALVGGGYASGVPASEMEAFLLGINWRRVIGGVGGRKLEPIEQKRQGITYTNNLRLGIRNSRIILAPGLFDTSAIDDLLRGFVGQARSQADFDRLPIPYRAVATDMVTGRMVVLDHGDLAQAMRASMAVPGAFAPVVIDGQILSDGGLTRNLPVDVARTLCGEVLIVVDLQAPPVQPERLQSAPQLLARMVDLMLESNERLQLQSLTAKDVLIEVPTGDIGSADFQRTPEAMALGAAAARRAAPQLARYAVSPDEYLAWRAKVTSEQGITTRVAKVQFTDVQRVNPKYLDSVAGIKPGDTVTTEQISQAVERMSALDDIESVGYQLHGDPENATLEWLPVVKSWGPNYLKVDFGMYGDASGDDLGVVFFLRHERTWVNSLGGQWRNQLQIGSQQLLDTSFYQPLEVTQRYFVEPKAFWNREWENVFYQNQNLARYQFGDWGGRFDFGVNISNFTQVRVGYVASERQASLQTGSPLLPQVNTTDAGIVVSVIHDSRDAETRATRGVAAALDYFKSDRALGAQRDWQRAEAGLAFAVPVRTDIFWVALAGGSNLGSKLPADRLFALGGPGSFPGYELAEQRAAGYWTVSGVYLWPLRELFSLRGRGMFVGVRLETGHAYEQLDGHSEGQLESVSLYITGRTPVGPLTVGFAMTGTSSHSLWFSLGRPVWQGTMLDRPLFR